MHSLTYSYTVQIRGDQTQNDYSFNTLDQISGSNTIEDVSKINVLNIIDHISGASGPNWLYERRNNIHANTVCC